MSQLVTRWHPRIRLNRLIGLFLTAALVLMFLSAFTSASPAHASGGCWSYNTWSDSATHQESNNPIIYWNDNGGPKLGLGLNSCGQYIMYMWAERGVCIDQCNPNPYYQIDWKRPGLNDWQKITVSPDQVYHSPGYMYYYLNNAHSGTYYNFAVTSCDSYGCGNWSPTVGIQT